MHTIIERLSVDGRLGVQRVLNLIDLEKADLLVRLLSRRPDCENDVRQMHASRLHQPQQNGQHSHSHGGQPESLRHALQGAEKLVA